MNSPLPDFDPRQLRAVLGAFTTGVTVITTQDQQGLCHGVTANSFSSLSLDPPLVLWSQALTSRSHPAFDTSSYFAVNILADHQIAISNHFAQSRDDKFKGIAHHSGVGGVPVLEGCAAHLECIKVGAHPYGDHVLYVGRVLRIGHHGGRSLAYSAGKYVLAHPCEEAARA